MGGLGPIHFSARASYRNNKEASRLYAELCEFQDCFWLFIDVDYFLCAKSSYHSQLMFMWFSVTETYLIFICHWHIFCVESILRFQYCFLLFTDVDIFFMCKMFLSFSTDIYVIFCYWNISMKWMHFMLIFHLLMLKYFLCGKYSRISIPVWIIFWCWLFFMCKMFLSFSTDVYVIFCYWNISMKCTHFILICHLLMLTFLCAKCSYHFQLMFMWFCCTKTYWWSGCTSSSFVIYCFWLFTDVDYFSCGKCSYHSWLMFMWFSVSETYWWSGWTSSSFVTYWCWHIFCVENILRFQYCFWLFTDVDIFFMCKMFLSFSTDIYVIFCYWNISMKWTHFMLIFHLLMLKYFLCGKYSRISIPVWIIYWCWHIFHVQNVLIILDWCLCDFLLLKHINEVHALHLDLSFTNVDFFMCKMFLSFSTHVYVIFCYWTYRWSGLTSSSFVIDIFLCRKYSTISILVLIIYWCWHIFHVQNVLIILNWCLCDFLLLKHIDEVDGLHLHLSLTDVDIFFVWKIFYDFKTAFDYLLMLTYFSCAKCSYHSRLMFMWFFVTETYQWQCTYFTFICHLLMLTYFCVENVPQFQYCFWLFTDVDYFSRAKCSYHVLIIFQNFNIAFDYLLMLTIFHVPKFL